MRKKKLEHYKTIITIIIGCIILCFVFKKSIFLHVALGVGILSLLSERLACYIHTFWMWLARITGYIMPNIVMSVLFIFFLTPLALLQRAFGKNKKLQLHHPGKSTFISTDKTFTKQDLEKPW